MSLLDHLKAHIVFEFYSTLAEQERSILSLLVTQEQRDFIYMSWRMNDWSLVTVEPEEMEVEASEASRPSHSGIVEDTGNCDILTSNLVQWSAETMVLDSCENIVSTRDSKEPDTAISYSDVDESSECSSCGSESDEASSDASSNNFDVEELSSEVECLESESSHCDKCGAVKTEHGAVGYVYPSYRLKQTCNIDADACGFCFCRPCVTDSSNTQFWWETQVHPPSRLNSKVRKPTPTDLG